jgi:type I restriction enzyme R subunit
MFTNLNSEDRLVQKTFAEHLQNKLGWDSVYAWNDETFGPDGTLGRLSERDVVLVRDLRCAIEKLNPDLPASVVETVVIKLTQSDFARSTVQHNREFYRLIRDGVPVSFRDEKKNQRNARAKVIDFRNPENNRFLAVRELKIQGLRSPHYNRRADIVCFVNGLPVVFIELKAVYVNIRAAYDGNLSDYFDTVPHVFHHNAFVVVSNGDRARYGSITADWERFAEWKRNDEKEKGGLEAEILLDGMLAKDRLLDLLENFVLFDDSKSGGTRKIVALNHQVLGVNKAVASMQYQEELKKEFPPDRRLVTYYPEKPEGDAALAVAAEAPEKPRELALVKRAHPDLGRLGVFWHTQGSGKSYSMLFFTEKVRRTMRGNFTFVVMTDREDLDDQIYKTFVGCGIVDPKTTPRADSGKRLKELLQEDHRFIFSLIHKFNQDVNPHQPYSLRDDIIVISDEAHRTQAGKLARNMRLALPNASFIGFTGTPLFKHDELTRRIFGSYVSRYDFKRAEEDGATVKLVYENRGEKLGLTTIDLNDRIAEKVEEAELDPDQIALLEKLLGKDYEIITADDRLERIAADFVEHCSTRWESGKSMLVCIDKVTCARMHQRIIPRWQAKAACVRAESESAAVAATQATGDEREALEKNAAYLQARAEWMEGTLIEIIISESQNEVKDFNKWGFDIRPHRALIKNGFEAGDGKTVDVETAFKNPEHPFRVAIVCAMWLTGFDVECLSTLYIDKPMRAHSLMQAIARANRVYPDKDCGVIVDYNGMLKSLREALAQYALGDDNETGGEEIVAPIEELLAGLVAAIEEGEKHLRSLGFEPNLLVGAKGFDRITGLRDAVEALYTSEDAKRRFEIISRQIFMRFKALLMEPSVFAYAERHDNIEAIYKKLQEKRDTADVTEVLKELHRIVNQAIQGMDTGADQSQGKTYDLSLIDFEKLRDEFEKKVRRKRTALEDIREVVEKKLQQMMSTNPLRMDFYKKYQEILADYNREKDRVTIEETFARLLALAQSLDAEQRRAVEEGLTDNELALFDLLLKREISKVDRERIKNASKSLLASVNEHLKAFEDWISKEQTQADVKVFILDHVLQSLPQPPYTDEEAAQAADRIYNYVWQRSAAGRVSDIDVAA